MTKLINRQLFATIRILRELCSYKHRETYIEQKLFCKKPNLVVNNLIAENVLVKNNLLKTKASLVYVFILRNFLFEFPFYMHFSISLHISILSHNLVIEVFFWIDFEIFSKLDELIKHFSFYSFKYYHIPSEFFIFY